MANYTGTWEDKTGALVRTIIQDALNSHDTKIADAITNISIETDPNDSLKVNWSYTKNGVTVNKEFTLAPTSESKMTINLDPQSTLKDIIKYKAKDIVIPYNYEVTEDGIKIANLLAEITATITNSKNVTKTVYWTVGLEKQYTISAVKTTSSSTNRSGEITISKDLLFEGKNTIEITFQVNYGGLIKSSSLITIDAINLKLDVVISGKNFYDLFKSNDLLNYQFTVTGTTSTIANRVLTRIYYNGPYIAMSSKTGSVLATFNSLRQGASAYPGVSSMDLYGKQRLFFLSFVENEDGTVSDISSNIVMMDLISALDIDAQGNVLAEAEGMFFATKLNDVAQVTSSIPIISITQYNTLTIPAYVYTTDSGVVAYNLNEDLLGDSDNIPAYTIDNGLTNISYEYPFKNSGTLHFSINNKNNDESDSLIISILVQSADSSISEPNDCLLNLSAFGATSGTREWKYGNYSTAFSNFDWSGNGFNGLELVLNNGATAVIQYPACGSTAYTVSFKFSAEASNESECMISCLSEGTGFEIYNDKAVIYNAGEGISTEFSTNETHEVTFVSYNEDYLKLLAIYIDGGIKCTTLKTTLVKHSTPTYITIKAESGEVKVSNVRAYKRGLSFTEIQSIYCLNLTSSSEIINYIKKNNVFNADTTVLGKHSTKVSIDKLPVGARYMIFESYGEVDPQTNEITSLDPTPWKTINGYISRDPETYKGIRHLLGSIKMVVKTEDNSAHPANFYAKRATISGLGTSSMAYPFKNFRIYFEKTIDASCPYYNTSTFYSSDSSEGDFGYTESFWTGIDPDFNGVTTEQSAKAEYALFKKSYPEDKDSIQRDSAPAKLFCLKADFAESSGSHNTGFARMANWVLTDSENICEDIEKSHLLPLLYVLSEAEKSGTVITKTDIRSTVDGRPIYLFTKIAGLDDSEAIYYGKYNLNNEKKSEDVFGFKKVVDYFKNDVVKTESTRLKVLFKDTENYYDACHEKYSIYESTKDGKTSYKYNTDKTVESLNLLNPVECWEFSNNTFKLLNPPGQYTGLGSFQYPYTPDSSYPLYSTYANYDPFTVKGEDGTLAWINQAWEYRFPALKDGSTGDLNYREGKCKPFLLDSLYKWLFKHNVTVLSLTTKNKMVSEFAENLHFYFNINYLLKYFILTKWFGNTDLRIKNCMIGFYCDPTAKDDNTGSYKGYGNSGTSEGTIGCPMGHMRAYYIFYDNDTILGVNNTGSLTNPWDMGEDKYPGYGEHGIWDNLQYCYDYYIAGNKQYILIYNLGKLIEKAYLSLRTLITNEKFRKYFNEDLCDKYCDAIFNVDAEIKYYHPSDRLTLLLEEGYNNAVDEPNRVANIHGDRKLHRSRWFGKRTIWLDSIFEAKSTSNYRYAFKTTGVKADGDGGQVKVRSAFKDWRFFAYSAGSTLATSKLLNKDEYCTLDCSNISVSDFVNVTALYGASELDWTNFNVNTHIADFLSDGKLPYLTKLTVNTYNSGKTKYMSVLNHVLLHFVSYNNVPNLEELYACNIKINTALNETAISHGTVDLSDMSKLKIIDFRGTPAELILPRSSNLTNLYIDNPTVLTISNKPNLILSITDNGDSVTTINLGTGNSTSINTKLLTIASTRAAVLDTFKLNADFGTSYAISTEELSLLEIIANLVISGKNNITVIGSIYNSSVTVEQQSKFKKAFPKLFVTTEFSGTLSLSLSTTSLREGESITIRPNTTLNSENDWTWKVGNLTIGYAVNGKLNNGTLELLEVEYDDSYITFKAKSSGSNNNATYYLTVTAVKDELEVSTVEIPILYIAVTGLRISANKNILENGGKANISITCTPTTHTKSALLSTLASWTCSNGSVANNLYTLTANYDGTLKLTSLGITSNILTFMYDMLIASIDSLLKTITLTTEASNAHGIKTLTSLSWIYYVLLAVYGVELLGGKSAIKISMLRDIDISRYINNIPVSYTEGDKLSDLIYDFEYFKYFNFSGTTFTIPSNLYFTNFSIPEVNNITTVKWTLSGPAHSEYKNIVFNSALTNGSINIDNSSNSDWIPNLKLNFSNCPNITKIYNGNGATVNGLMSVSIKYKEGDLTAGDEIFIYPPNLELLGNMNFDTKGNQLDSNNYPPTMFNLKSDVADISIDNKLAYNPIYKISDVSKLIKLGAIYGYPVAKTTGTMLIPTSNVTDTYYTYYNLRLVPDAVESDGFELTSINTIGSGTFASSEETVYSARISLYVKYIGSKAFFRFNGDIVSSLSNNNSQIFTNVNSIGSYAFAYLNKSLDITLDSDSLAFGKGIGEEAFALSDSAVNYHSIRIIGSSVFAYTATSFGSGMKNSLYITSEIKNIISQSIETFNLVLENVKVYVDGTRINP